MKNNIVTEKEAVSPVIGVILMVVMAVVIAAVVYLWIVGIIGGGVKETPGVELSVKKENGNYTVTILKASGEVSVYDVNFFIADKNGKTVKNGRVSEIYGDAEGNISFFDLNKDEKISVNDYFIIKGEYAKQDYGFRLMYSLTGGIMGEIKLS